MNYLCEDCRGSGYVTDLDGHLDICEKCWGLGYLVAREDPRPKLEGMEKQIRRNSLYVMLAITVSAWGVIVLFSMYITFNIYDYFVLFTGPYYLGLLGSSLYVRHKNKQRGKAGEASNSHGH